MLRAGFQDGWTGRSRMFNVFTAAKGQKSLKGRRQQDAADASTTAKTIVFSVKRHL